MGTHGWVIGMSAFDRSPHPLVERLSPSLVSTSWRPLTDAVMAGQHSNLYVRGWTAHESFSEADLLAIFSSHGDIQSLRLVAGSEAGQQAPHAFVKYENPSQVGAAPRTKRAGNRNGGPQPPAAVQAQFTETQFSREVVVLVPRPPCQGHPTTSLRLLQRDMWWPA